MLFRSYVHDVTTGRRIKVDLGSNTDIYLGRVDWSADGKTLYVQRQSRDQKTLDLLAVDPATGMIYIPSRNAFAVTALTKPDASLNSNLLYMQGTPRNPNMPEGLPLFKPPYSRMTAIDMNTGTHVWMVPTGNGDRIRNNPRVKALNLPPVGGDTTMSGPLLTKTVLIYALTTGGSSGGPRLVAYDKATGKELASADLPGAAIGTPMTYQANGKQYIAITVQGRAQGDVPELVALSLQ